MVREILSIGIGKCGVHLGHRVWIQNHAESKISRDGQLTGDNWIKIGPTNKREEEKSVQCFYTETESSRLVPRNIFVDSDPNIMDGLKNSDYAQLYPDACLLSGTQDAAYNFACARYSIGPQMIDSIKDALRKQIESCDSLQGFIVTRSVGGGTGSGLGALILEGLAADYRKKSKVEMAVYPSPHRSACVVEAYNALFAIHGSLDKSSTDASIVFGNEAIYELCQRKLDIRRPSLESLNRVISKHISGITAPIRFEWDMRIELKYVTVYNPPTTCRKCDCCLYFLSEYVTNLVPFPRLHFMMTSYVPLVTKQKKESQKCDVQSIAERSVHSRNFSVKCEDFDVEEDKHYAIWMIFRGDVRGKKANASIQWLKTNKKCTMIGWSPTEFKMSLVQPVEAATKADPIATHDRTLTMLSCPSFMGRILTERVTKKSDLMYRQRAYVHTYVAEGMEEGEFAEAIQDLRYLDRDYLDTVREQATDETADEDSY